MEGSEPVVKSTRHEQETSEPVVKSTRHEQETCNGGIGTCGLENQWSSQPDMSRLDAMEGSEASGQVNQT